MRLKGGLWLMLAMVGSWLAPSAAFAQSAIAGVVRDTSGAVLPGVTVEAASPALIEKVRAVTSDDRGVYQVVGLVAGTYTVTFTLGGFSVVKREALELPSNFTATVNAELRVGALEETVTVSGASPVVDVQSTAKSQTLNREVLDAIPTGRSAQTAAALVPGVVMGTPDVAGSNGMNQNASQAHGMAGEQATVLLDGIQLNGMCGNGATQSYSNTQNYQEIVVQNSGAGADVSAGGVRQNLITRRGGNEFHGSGALAFASGKWQANALSPDLVARGLTKGDSFDKIYDYEAGLGGKIIKDRLWWFAAARKNEVDTLVADTFNPDGTQGVNPQYVKNSSLRLSGQLNSRMQLNGYYDRVWKFIGAAMSGGQAPSAAILTSPSPLYDQAQVKWTFAASNRLLIEAGSNHYQAYRTNSYEPNCSCYGLAYGSAAWLANVTHRDLSLGTLTGAAPIGPTTQDPTRRFFDGSVTYVTGSHNIKVGVQDQKGFETFAYDKNGDLELNYQNGVPTSAAIFNTPVRYSNSMDAFWGLYGQDTWTAKRFTVNAGLRWEDFGASIPAEVVGPGRFVGDRNYGGDTFPTWKSLNPRFGVVYDVSGNGKTAVKFSVNKYQTQLTDGLTNAYNPIRSQSATVTWNDLNKDNIAQTNELNLAQLPAGFGTVTPGCSVIATPGVPACATSQLDPNRKRGANLQYSLGIQRELLPRVSVNANYFHTEFYDLGMTYNAAQQSSDYTPVQIASPLDGSAITIYNVSAAARSKVLNLLTNDPNAKKWTNAAEFGFSARLSRGAVLFGGLSMDRTIQIACDDPTNPNNLLYCDQSASHIPLLINMKLSGSMQLPYSITLGASFQSYKYMIGGAAVGNVTANYGTQWLITPTTRYAANCTGPCTPGALVDPGMTVASLSVPLIAPGTESSDRINQLDINVGRWITVGRIKVEPELSLFNALNSLAAYGFRSFNYATTSYFQPSTILPPRIVRLGMQVKW
ncbi:MAG: Outer rane receptor for ferrienterochelin and colicin [Acidobacteria bacterium]|nr:Outer rane receptor for ferrienterochelin and colicin [Acidobacteriota bacterium]